MLWETIGILAAICVTIQWIPQVWHALRSRRLHDLNWGLLCVGLLGAALWVAYGLHLQDPIIVTTNVMVGFFLLLLSGMKRAFDR
ncbi:PQ-loop repeat-containing protein [Candidatus Woesearchaeota archaeon]|nr:PQ-loop repeat-containing protein [Candidatus Woesearchaeota archaeon]